MLRRLFREENNVGGGGAPAAVVESASTAKRGDAAMASFGELETRLDVFEGRAREAVNVLSRQCQAIAELVLSSKGMAGCVRILYEGQALEETDAAKNGDAILAIINDFRSVCIAPLQIKLSAIPELKIRCNHRHSAEGIVSHYERKLREIRAKKRVDRSRERRNQVKLDAASKRFEDIDDELRSDIAALLLNGIDVLVGDSVETLLLQVQTLAAQLLTANATQLRSQLEQYRRASKTKSEPDPAGDLNNESERDASPVASFDAASGSDQKQPLAIDVNNVPNAIKIMPKHVLSEKHSVCAPRKHTVGTRTWNLHRHIKDSMASGLDLADCIKLPDGYQLHEWVAVHVVDFFNEVSLLYGTISEFCTPESCPQMSAGPCYTYLWADGVQQVTPVSLPAAEYVDRLLKWVEDQLADSTLFPVDDASSSVDSQRVLPAARNILKRLFRVYAHMYHNHLPSFAALHAESHLHFCFKRFVLFVREFNLVERKELHALGKLIHALHLEPATDM